MKENIINATLVLLLVYTEPSASLASTTAKWAESSLLCEQNNISWLSRGPDSSGGVWIGCKRLILKLSGFLLAMEVESPYMHPNQRLILIQKWYDTRDIQLTNNPSIVLRLMPEIVKPSNQGPTNEVSPPPLSYLRLCQRRYRKPRS